MSRLEELIQELCPNGVEYKKLIELGKFYGGLSGKSKEDFKDGNMKFITYMNVFKNPSLDLSINEKVKIMPNEKQRKLEYGDVIFTGSSENIDECAMSSVVTMRLDEDIYLNSFCFVWHPNDISLFNLDFLKHLFRSSELRRQLVRTASGVTRFNVSKKKMEDVRIPIPPLEVQSEIVRILDNFTLLTAELTAELTARKQQYNYYRSQLLNFDETIKKISLSDIAKFTYGYTDKALDIGDTRYIRITDIDDEGCLVLKNAKYINGNSESSKYLLKYGDLLVARTGATFGKTLYYGSNAPAVYASFLIKIELDNSIILNRYYWHYSKSKEYWEQANKLVSIGGQQQFNANAIRRLVVPVPSIAVQERIINVLDNFDSICTDLGIGLPAEIEARKQQYEFYRTKLLTMLSEGVDLSKQASKQASKQDR